VHVSAQQGATAAGQSVAVFAYAKIHAPLASRWA